jgi:hypothetical protein
MPRSNDLVYLLPTGTTRAQLAIDGPASATFNTVIEAQAAYRGAAGNAITLALAAGGTWVPNVGTLTLAGNATNAAATGTLTLTGNPADTQTVTIGAKTYTFQAVLTNVDGNVLIGANAAATIVNLVAAIMLGAGAGTGYAAATTAHPTVTAVDGAGDTVVVTAITPGSAGNSIASTETMDNASWGGATLSGGTTETVTIGSTVYTWKNTLTTAYDVKIGGSASLSIDNLIAAINANGTPGTHYFAGTLIHPSVRAFAGAGDTMVVHTNSDTILTAVGTLIATTETMASGSWGATTLADGTNGTNVAFSVAGTAISCVFSSGYTTVSDFEAAILADAAVSALIAVKTAGTTPLYQLVITDDDFTATPLSGSGATSSAAPSLTVKTAYRPAPFPADEALALVWSEAGSGTMDVTVTLWGWEEITSRGHLIGVLNGGDAIPEATTDQISYSELIVGIGGYSAYYASIASPGGTATEVAVALKFLRPGDRA